MERKNKNLKKESKFFDNIIGGSADKYSPHYKICSKCGHPGIKSGNNLICPRCNPKEYDDYISTSEPKKFFHKHWGVKE